MAGFLGAGVLVVTVTVAIFLWTCCQRQYRRMTFKLSNGPFDSPTDPPLKFIHMLKGISIYPETLSNANKIIRVGRRSSSRQRGHDSDIEGHAHLQMNHLVPPKLERALPIRADYCCSDSSSCESSSKTTTPFGFDSPSLGTLDLAIDYNFPKKALVVTIVGARDLPAVNEQTGSSDPYVKMSILPEKKHHVKTRVMRKSLEPSFDETFTFYGVSFSALADLTLHFLVLSFDRFARDDVIGEALVSLSGIELSAGKVNISQQITKRNVQVRRNVRRNSNTAAFGQCCRLVCIINVVVILLAVDSYSLFALEFLLHLVVFSSHLVTRLTPMSGDYYQPGVPRLTHASSEPR